MTGKYGPFHRRKTNTQDYDTACKQVSSKEIWGLAVKTGGLFPVVKAYFQPLCCQSGPAGCWEGEGIELGPTSSRP